VSGGHSRGAESSVTCATDAAQVARQHAHAAADVEAAPGAVRDSGEDHAV
jgi:hypothetical protein